jgi:dipeptidyl aminopeptidase/acylaminoacyl peptidase
VFGLTRYAFLEDGSIVCIYNQDGLEHLGLISPKSDEVKPIETPFTALAYLQSGLDDEIYFVGGSFQDASSVVRMRVGSGQIEKVRPRDEEAFDPGYLSQPSPIEFPTEGGITAYALYYPPANKDYIGPTDALPPLLVISHGGPTSAAKTHLRLEIQYWTSRGIGVVDVNYGGSTGYGRSFRQRLNGQWGVVDTQDCIAAAKFLVEEDNVDGTRLAVRGGSAGGYTTLSALAFHDLFAAGASYYGVADLEALTIDTHKFETQYLERLVGPYPQEKDLYHARSPIYFADRISAPMILFQGLEDQVVPPAQAEMMVEALDKNKVPYAYLAFEGEQHGFRCAETVIRCLEAELYFYAKIFDIKLIDPIEAVDIKHA